MSILRFVPTEYRLVASESLKNQGWCCPSGLLGSLEVRASESSSLSGSVPAVVVGTSPRQPVGLKGLARLAGSSDSAATGVAAGSKKEETPRDYAGPSSGMARHDAAMAPKA